MPEYIKGNCCFKISAHTDVHYHCIYCLGRSLLARAGIMSSTDRDILRRLQESKTPGFGKTLTLAMLRRSERLEIPSWFLHKHGDRFHKVLTLTGPSGQAWSVPLIVRTSATRPRESPRVFLGRAWTGFAKENGFQLGNEVSFWLVARSCFQVVLRSPQFTQRTATTETSKGDGRSGTSGDDITTEIAQQNSKSTSNDEEIVQVPSDNANTNSVESHDPACWVEAPAPQRPTSNVREEQYVNYPGLQSAITANARFPQFVKRLTRNSLDGRGMELPFSFVRDHGDKLHGYVTLLGESGHLRVVDLRVTTFWGQGRVHLAKGWRNFSQEHGFSEGDVLLFSLMGVSTFVVKTFPGARKLAD